MVHPQVTMGSSSYSFPIQGASTQPTDPQLVPFHPSVTHGEKHHHPDTQGSTFHPQSAQTFTSQPLPPSQGAAFQHASTYGSTPNPPATKGNSSNLKTAPTNIPATQKLWKPNPTPVKSHTPTQQGSTPTTSTSLLNATFGNNEVLNCKQPYR